MKFTLVWLLMIGTSCAEFNESIDLGYGFNESTLYWVGMPGFNLSDLVSVADPYRLSKQFAAAEHGGTHLDAPYHFNPNGWKVADIPLDRLIVSAVVVNKREAAAENSDTEVTVEDLEQWEQVYGPLPNQSVIIFDFGWASKYPNKTAYFGLPSYNESEDLHFPGVSQGAADWLVHSGKVVGVGVDTASVDPGVNKEFIAHRILTAANIYLLENLALAGTDLPARGIQLIVLPMKITNGTGAPLRIIAQPAMSAAVSFLSRVLSWLVSVWCTITTIVK